MDKIYLVTFLNLDHSKYTDHFYFRSKDKAINKMNSLKDERWEQTGQYSFNRETIDGCYFCGLEEIQLED